MLGDNLTLIFDKHFCTMINLFDKYCISHLMITTNDTRFIKLGSNTCSIMKIWNSMFCAIRNGMRLLRTKKRLRCRSRYGNTTATFCRDLHSLGRKRPPASKAGNA